MDEKEEKRRKLIKGYVIASVIVGIIIILYTLSLLHYMGIINLNLFVYKYDWRDDEVLDYGNSIKSKTSYNGSIRYNPSYNSSIYLAPAYNTSNSGN